MKASDRFAKGSAVYTCLSCGKRTRETGSGESDNHLCVACYDESGEENYHLDNHAGDFKTCGLCHPAIG